MIYPIKIEKIPSMKGKQFIPFISSNNVPIKEN
jgi:hypothetical protein